MNLHLVVRTLYLLGLLTLAIFMLLQGSYAMAVPGPPTGCGISSLDDCAAAQDETIGIGVGGGHPDRRGKPRPGDGSPGRSGPQVVVEVRHVAACDGNGLEGSNELCEQATITCEGEDEVRFWRYRREYPVGTVPPPFQRVLAPPSVCLGPEDPQIDPLDAIPAIVDREFKRVVVLKGVAEVSPVPDTLISVPTRFTTQAPASYDIPLTILGQSVLITATADSWTWHFGDGTQQRLTASSGTEHVYTRSGARSAYVVIEWTGTYRIGADPTVRVVNGTATTTGEPVAIAVRQARSELVDKPG